LSGASIKALIKLKEAENDDEDEEYSEDKIKAEKKLKVHKPIIDGIRLCNNVLKFKPSFHSI